MIRHFYTSKCDHSTNSRNHWSAGNLTTILDCVPLPMPVLDGGSPWMMSWAFLWLWIAFPTWVCEHCLIESSMGIKYVNAAAVPTGNRPVEVPYVRSGSSGNHFLPFRWPVHRNSIWPSILKPEFVCFLCPRLLSTCYKSHKSLISLSLFFFSWIHLLWRMIIYVFVLISRIDQN